MAAPGDVLTCTEVDASGTCTASAYLPPASVLPTMSIADAQAIGLAIALLWATAWGIRQLIRLLRDS